MVSPSLLSPSLPFKSGGSPKAPSLPGKLRGSRSRKDTMSTALCSSDSSVGTLNGTGFDSPSRTQATTADQSSSSPTNMQKATEGPHTDTYRLLSPEVGALSYALPRAGTGLNASEGGELPNKTTTTSEFRAHGTSPSGACLGSNLSPWRRRVSNETPREGSSSPPRELAHHVTNRQSRKETMKAIGSEVAGMVSRPILRRLTRRRSTAGFASRNVPSKAPHNEKPMFEKHVPQAAIDSIRSALLRTDGWPMSRFLDEVMGCYDIDAAEWKPDPAIAGTLVRKCQYKAPVPADVPDTIKRIVGLPDVVTTTSAFRLHSGPGEVTLVQQSYTRDVMYGDRFKIQHTISFKQEPDGVVSRQWASVVWDQPLPWTHSMIRHFVEKKATADSRKMAPQVLRMIEEAGEMSNDPK